MCLKFNKGQATAKAPAPSLPPLFLSFSHFHYVQSSTLIPHKQASRSAVCFLTCLAASVFPLLSVLLSAKTITLSPSNLCTVWKLLFPFYFILLHLHHLFFVSLFSSLTHHLPHLLSHLCCLPSSGHSFICGSCSAFLTCWNNWPHGYDINVPLRDKKKCWCQSANFTLFLQFL